MSWRSREAAPIDVQAVWRAEQSLSKRKRRARYKCGNNFVRLVNIKPWPIYVTDHIPDLADLHSRPVVAEEVKAPEAEPFKQESQAEEAKTEKDEKTEKNDKKDSGDEDSSSEEEQVPQRTFAPNKLINRKVATWRGDITRLEIGAVVNAANESLLGGGGIDGAIHSAAGNDLYKECLTLDGADTGETKITRGYRLPSQYILHTVGPRGEYPTKLRACYQSCLSLVDQHKIRSVAFCGVSTGIFGYPLERATRVALQTVREWLEVPGNADKVDSIIFCTFLAKEEECYNRLMQEFFPLTPDPEFVSEHESFVSGYKSADEPPSDDEEEKRKKAEVEEANRKAEEEKKLQAAMEERKKKEEEEKKKAEEEEKLKEAARQQQDAVEAAAAQWRKDAEKQKEEEQVKMALQAAAAAAAAAADEQQKNQKELEAAQLKAAEEAAKKAAVHSPTPAPAPAVISPAPATVASPAPSTQAAPKKPEEPKKDHGSWYSSPVLIGSVAVVALAFGFLGFRVMRQ